jgi:hypothetical protein
VGGASGPATVVVNGSRTGYIATIWPTSLVSSAPQVGGLIAAAFFPYGQRVQATFDASLEIGSNRTKWAQVGRQGEDAALEALTESGYNVVASQLYVSIASPISLSMVV